MAERDQVPEHDAGRGIPERGPGTGDDRDERGRPSGTMPEHEGGKGVPERGTGDRQGKAATD